MATYEELHNLLAQESVLRNRVKVAVLVAAQAISVEPPATANHAFRLIWAKQAFQNPEARAAELFPALLAINKGATVAQILGASDTAIQGAVDGVINLFADGV